jgi:hypothetical protein
MWRWVIRVYVSILLFLVLLFFCSAFLIRLAHLLSKAGSPVVAHWIHAHNLLTMFLLGVVAGQAFLGSNFTGRGWFRKKGGQTFEGFKLERIKPWTWVFGSLIFLLGTVLWCLEQGKAGVFSKLSLRTFYHDLFIQDCSNAFVTGYRSEIAATCAMQFLLAGVWLASIGYSLAPKVRKRGATFWRSLRRAPESATPFDESPDRSVKEKTESR